MSKNPKKNSVVFYVLAAVLLLSVIAHVTVFHAIQKRSQIESFEYDTIAKNMITGQGYSFNYIGAIYRSFAPPLYAILIYLIYLVSGVYNAPIIYLQITVSLITALLIFFISERIGNRWSAILAATLCAFHPGLFLYSVKKIHALTLDTLLFILVLLSMMRLRENMSPRRAIFAGIFFGLAALSRPSIMAFLPFAAGWLIISSNKTSAVWKYITMLILAMAIPILTWTARNYLVHKQVIISTTCDTEVFWRGNNDRATGASYDPARITILEKDKNLFNKIKTLNELERRALFQKEAAAFIKNNPINFLKLYIRKLFYFWWFSPVSGLLYLPYYLLWYKAFYALILIFAVIGLFCIITENNSKIQINALLLISFLISISLFQALYYVEGRHRWSAEPILMIFSAVGIFSVLKKVKMDIL